MNDGPSRRLRRLTEALAGQITALELAGCTPEQVGRIAIAALNDAYDAAIERELRRRTQTERGES